MNKYNFDEDDKIVYMITASVAILVGMFFFGFYCGQESVMGSIK